MLRDPDLGGDVGLKRFGDGKACCLFAAVTTHTHTQIQVVAISVISDQRSAQPKWDEPNGVDV